MDEIEKCFREFDPYLCNVIMSKIFKNDFQYEKSHFINLLKNEFYNKDPTFAKKCVENVIKPTSSIKIKDPDVIKRIRDINLLYTLKFAFTPNLKIESKVTGKALELVAESVLKWKLKDSVKLDYEFVDWRGFDFLIFDKTTYDWKCGIQCKTAFHESGFLGYKKELRDMEDFAKNFEMGKKFVMFCGCVNQSSQEKIRKAFEKIGWELYYLWIDIESNRDINSYEIDASFYEFIDTIEKIAKT
jgi:hypothetical protein